MYTYIHRNIEYINIHTYIYSVTQPIRFLDEDVSSWSGSGGESIAGEDGGRESESYDAAGALQLHLKVYKGAYTVSAQI